MADIVRFAAVMGPLSSLFDLMTFAALILVFDTAPEVFRTAWFLESMATQILVIFVIRTRGRPWADRPSPALAASSLAALAAAILLPFTPAGAWFGFAVPSLPILLGIAAIVVVYLVAAEAVKPWAMPVGAADPGPPSPRPVAVTGARPRSRGTGVGTALRGPSRQASV